MPLCPHMILQISATFAADRHLKLSSILMGLFHYQLPVLGDDAEQGRRPLLTVIATRAWLLCGFIRGDNDVVALISARR